MESVMLDGLDRRLLHALHFDGRAPFSRLAEVLGVSDRTVARRVARLRADGAARVTAVVDGPGTGHAEWLVRLRVPPGDSALLAGALARRPDTSWVTVLSAGTEVTCLLRAPRADAAPLRTLARSPKVREVHAHRLLRHLTEHPWRGRTSALDPDQVAALQTAVEGGAPGDGDAAPVALNDLDRRLLPVLVADGRAAYPLLARRTGWSESAVRRRLTELRRRRALRFDIDTDPALFGYAVQCMLWLTVAPAHLTAVSGSLAADAEVAFVGGTTGPHNLFTIVVCRDEDALNTYLTDRISALEGVERVETAPVAFYTKRLVPTR